MNNSQPTEQGANQAPGLTLNLLPAGLSLLCPGLGQLIQGRKIFVLHFGIYALQVLTLRKIFFIGVNYWSGNNVIHFDMDQRFPFLMVFCLILPFFTLLFSSLDAAIWKPGQSLSFTAPIKRIAVYTVILAVLMMFLLVPPRGAIENAQRIQCSHHLKMIGLALNSYHTFHGSFPPAYTVDKSGKPLHSWRVLILPLLEKQELYDQIRLDEPWNSEYNQQFHHLVPHMYQCPASRKNGITTRFFPKLDDIPGSCYYSVVIGDETPFPGAASTRIRDILDGTSNTILVVERPLPVCWMDPNHEIRFDTAAKGINRDLFGIGSVHPGGANVVFADGSIRFLSEILCLKIFQSFLTKAAGDAGPCCPPP